MVSLVLQAAIICGTTWFLWKLLRGLIVKTDLDKLPGPSSSSFLYGNLKELYSRQGLGYHRGLGEQYGPVLRLHGKFGQNILYTFDPKAMHHIVVKDQDSFQETTWFTRTLHHLFGPGLLATLGEDTPSSGKSPRANHV
ncbi:hypothetical protein GY45DRAFT_1340580 [Cubamyces sp. BRFM 1775]|nr:hypothetical protein GY45DRAFT_1340580 [Cubamyces sp. BRFM 1775]